MIESPQTARSILLSFLVNRALTAVVKGNAHYDNISSASLFDNGVQPGVIVLHRYMLLLIFDIVFE